MWQDVKSWTAAVAGVSAIIGLLLGAMKLYQELGLPMLATQEHVAEKIAPVVSTMQGMRGDITRNSLANALQRRDQIDNSIAQWKREMLRDDAASSGESHALDQQRIDELIEQRAAIDRRIQELQRELYGER